MDPLLERTLPAERRRRSYPDVPRTTTRVPGKFETWAWSPIVAFRIGLTLGYASMIYFGISGLIAGVPAFASTAPEQWTPIWASVLILGGVLGAIGSIGDTMRLRMTELAGSWLLFLSAGTYATILLLLAYGVTGTPDVYRATAGSGLVALGVQPFVRMLWLLSQIGRKK